MSISIMGSVNSYTKTLKLQTQWNLKQKSGDYNSHKKSLEEWLDTSQQALKRGLTGNNPDDEEGKKKLNNIMQKIYAGAKLTSKEKEYLKAKNPQAYEKLRSIEQEQKAYEKKLRQCKTKEEVQRLKMNQIASSLSVIGSVRNNSHIPESKKLEICMQEKMRMDKIEQSTSAFVQSGEYDRLPTEAEEAKARKEEKQQQTKPQKPQKPEQPEQTEQPDVSTKTEQTPEQPGVKNPESTPTENTQSAPTPAKPAVKVQANTDQTTQSSEHKVDSPELRKVRRARRQAARAAYTATQTASPTVSQPTLNVNA